MEGQGQSLISLVDDRKEYLSFEVETNPLDGSFDSYVGCFVAPVVLRYHAPVVKALLEVFKPPESVRLKQLAAAAMLRYEQVKAKSVAGFQHVVDRKPKVKLELRIEPATVVVTNGNFDGPFDAEKPNLVMQLGLLTMNTVDEVTEFMRNFHAKTEEERRVEELRLRAANKFESHLSNVSIHFANSYHGDVETDGAFGSMELTNCSIKGYITNEGQLQFESEIFSLTMEDKREETKIHTLLDKMEKRHDGSMPSVSRKASVREQPLVHMRFEMDATTGEKVIDLNSQRFYLLLNPEFIASLTNFFVVPESSSIAEEARQYSNPVARRDGDEALVATCPTGVEIAEAAGEGGETAPRKQSSVEEPPPGTLTMKCKIRDIEVILIENAYEPEESQALILSFNTVLEANNDSGVQHFTGSVQNLGIVSTRYSDEMLKQPHDADDSRSYSVLERVNIQMAGTIAPGVGSQDFAICIDSIHIKVSPSVIRMLSAVATQFTSHQAKIRDRRASTPYLKEYPDYWAPRPIEHGKYWWFEEVAEEGDEGLPFQAVARRAQDAQKKPGQAKEERAEFIIERFVITIEAGMHEHTAPMILVESSLRAVAENWSSKLVTEASMGLQVSYYNESFSVWEPVIEPVWSKQTREWESWQLKMLVEAHGEDEYIEEYREEEGKLIHLIQPKMTVNIDAKDRMEITVTKSFLQLANKLSSAFEEAAKQISPVPSGRSLPGAAPYLVLNDTGIDVQAANTSTLQLKDGSNRDAGVMHNHGHAELEPPAHLNRSQIGLKIGSDAQPAGVGDKSMLLMKLKYRLDFKAMDTEREVNVMRAEKRCLHLPLEADSGRKWALLVDTRLENSRHIVQLSSLVKFVNHMDVAICVLAENPVEKSRLSECGTAKTDGTLLYVPLPLVYSATGEFQFQPEGDAYDRSNESVSWHDFEHHKRNPVRCDLASDSTQGLYLDLVVEEERVMGERGKATVESAFTVHIFPPLYFRNLLPVAVEVTKPITHTLEGGDGVNLNLIHPLPFEFQLTYNDCVYEAKMRVPRAPNDLETIKLVARDDPERVLVSFRARLTRWISKYG